MVKVNLHLYNLTNEQKVVVPVDQEQSPLESCEISKYKHCTLKHEICYCGL